MTYSCPNCGHTVDELPDAVIIDSGPKAGTSKGHSDQSTHICPSCESEEWYIGWVTE
jgi:predicted RNA-binding Zn-ribbon protein involved in translation (DUF1610 family)